MASLFLGNIYSATTVFFMRRSFCLYLNVDTKIYILVQTKNNQEIEDMNWEQDAVYMDYLLRVSDSLAGGQGARPAFNKSRQRVYSPIFVDYTLILSHGIALIAVYIW